MFVSPSPLRRWPGARRPLLTVTRLARLPTTTDYFRPVFSWYEFGFATKPGPRVTGVTVYGTPPARGVYPVACEGLPFASAW